MTSPRSPETWTGIPSLASKHRTLTAMLQRLPTAGAGSIALSILATPGPSGRRGVSPGSAGAAAHQAGARTGTAAGAGHEAGPVTWGAGTAGAAARARWRGAARAPVGRADGDVGPAVGDDVWLISQRLWPGGT